MVGTKHTEKMLLDAFERLKAGKPRNMALKEKALKGRQLVNFVNVAIEAGVSRSLIAHDGCLYPHVRSSILAYVTSSPKPAVSPALVAELRAEIRDLHRQIELRDTFNAELLLELERLSNDRDGHHPERENVVNFRKDRRRRDERKPDPTR